MKWQQGRQGTGYEKLLLFQSRRLMCDVWLLRSSPGVAIPEHVDSVPGYRHYRANVILRPALVGGRFLADDWIVNWSRLKIFRSDKPHSVSAIDAGTRLVLSFGLCLKETT